MGYRDILTDAIERMVQEGKVTFVDCMNCLDQYMFGRVIGDLYVARIEVIFDLVDILERMSPRRLLLSPYKHLFKDLRDDELDDIARRIDAQLLRLSNKCEVVTIEWDTQYRQRGQ